jgi:hypothetical protein
LDVGSDVIEAMADTVDGRPPVTADATADALDPLPISVQLAASALAIRATFLVLIYVPALFGKPLPGIGGRAWQWDYLVWAAIFGALAVGLWSRSPRAWTWAVAGLVLRILSWVAWAWFDAHANPAAWRMSSWFGWRAAEAMAWMLGPLALLLLPASRRALGSAPGAAASPRGSLRLPIAVHVAASALTIRAVFNLLDLPAQWPRQPPEIGSSILRAVGLVVISAIFLRLARGLWLGQSSARNWTIRLMLIALAGYVGWVLYFQHALPGHFTYAEFFSWPEIRNRVWVYGPLVLLLLPASRRAFAAPA